MSKFVNLDQIKVLATKVKTEDEALGAQISEVTSRVDGLIATGGEANILNGVKVNGTALTITDKMVDILIATGEENGTLSVNGAAVAIKGLADLAYKSKIGEEDLNEALLASIAAKATEADLSALEVRVEDAEGRISVLENAGFQNAEQVQAAIAAAAHLKYSVVDALPEASAADTNTWYLLLNEETGHYDIYGLIEGELKLIDDTTIDLTGYSTTEAMKAYVAQEITALNVSQYATDEEMAAAVKRIGDLETALGNYYTKTETEEYVGGQFEAFQTSVIDPITASISALGDRVTALEEGMDGYATDEEAAQAASAVVTAAHASDDEFQGAMDEVWTPTEG